MEYVTAHMWQRLGFAVGPIFFFLDNIDWESSSHRFLLEDSFFVFFFSRNGVSL